MFSEHHIEKLTESITQLALAIKGRVEDDKTKILDRIEKLERKIMSAITDWAAQEQADLATISATLDGIVTGVAALEKMITDLNNSPGTLSASDQAALDAIQAASKALVAKSAAISTAPPAPPTP